MIVHILKMCTSYFVHVSYFFSHFWGVLNLDIFSIRNAKGMPSLCNLYIQKFLFFFIQTLPNDFSHIEDVHLLFCACFIIFFSFLRGVELRHFFHPQFLGGA